MYAPVILTSKINDTIEISNPFKGDLLSIVLKADRTSCYKIFDENLQEYVKDYGFNTLMSELCRAFECVHNLDWYNDRCNGKNELKRAPKQVTVEGILYEEVIPEVQRTLVKWAEFNKAECDASLARFKNAKIQLELSELIMGIKAAKFSIPEIIDEIKKIKDANKLKE